MESAREGCHIILKLGDGEDVFNSLEIILEQYRLKGALVLSGIGMLRDFEIGYFDGKKYQNEAHEEPHELVSLHGSISTEGGLVIHLHAALAGKDHSLIGGHLHKATACIVNEIVLSAVEETRMERAPDPSTGLKLLHLGD
ncbi:MAG: DUF296 domain-containing protein [Euryarchaeota archaeon]|nr:DUF296 domain-containing protein [Euryarchaeota archaeon]